QAGAALASQGDAVADSQDGLLEELLKQMNDQQWEKAVAVAERLYVEQPHSIYLASVLGELYARMGHGNTAHFYWKQVMITTPDAVLSRVARMYVERVRG